MKVSQLDMIRFFIFIACIVASSGPSQQVGFLLHRLQLTPKVHIQTPHRGFTVLLFILYFSLQADDFHLPPFKYILIPFIVFSGEFQLMHLELSKPRATLSREEKLISASFSPRRRKNSRNENELRNYLQNGFQPELVHLPLLCVNPALYIALKYCISL